MKKYKLNEDFFDDVVTEIEPESARENTRMTPDELLSSYRYMFVIRGCISPDVEEIDDETCGRINESLLETLAGSSFIEDFGTGYTYVSNSRQPVSGKKNFIPFPDENTREFIEGNYNLISYRTIYLTFGADVTFTPMRMVRFLAMVNPAIRSGNDTFSWCATVLEDRNGDIRKNESINLNYMHQFVTSNFDNDTRDNFIQQHTFKKVLQLSSFFAPEQMIKSTRNVCRLKPGSYIVFQNALMRSITGHYIRHLGTNGQYVQTTKQIKMKESQMNLIGHADMRNAVRFAGAFICCFDINNMNSAIMVSADAAKDGPAKTFLDMSRNGKAVPETTQVRCAIISNRDKIPYIAYWLGYAESGGVFYFGALYLPVPDTSIEDIREYTREIARCLNSDIDSDYVTKSIYNAVLN